MSTKALGNDCLMSLQGDLSFITNLRLHFLPIYVPLMINLPYTHRKPWIEYLIVNFYCKCWIQRNADVFKDQFATISKQVRQ